MRTLLLALLGATARAVVHEAWATWLHGRLVIEAKFFKGAAVHGRYEDTIETTGWATLELETLPGALAATLDDARVQYLLGYLEGHLTADRIVKHLANGMANAQPSPAVMKYFEEQSDWIHGQIKANANTDPYWRQVEFLLQRLSGMSHGQSERDRTEGGQPEISWPAWLLLQAWPDLEEIKIRMDGQGGADLSRGDHCTVLLKEVEDGLVMAHNTWTEYWEMQRIWKHIRMEHVHDQSFHNRQISFSSYPGALGSQDDWYMMGDLLVTETTAHCLDKARIQKFVQPQAVLPSMRAMVANVLATDGPSWARAFERENSGTNNNMWMVVDRRREKESSSLLYVLEQMPGLIVHRDMTATLRAQGYWASYNNPLFPEIRNVSGYAQRARTDPFFDHDRTPRAQLAARDHDKVHSVDDLMRLMTSNNYTRDPLSKGCPRYSWAARFDLPTLPGKSCDWVYCEDCAPSAMGAIDAKVSDLARMGDLSTYAVSGPPRDGVPAFSWDEAAMARIGGAHDGVPARFEFDPVNLTPSWNKQKLVFM